MIPFFVQIKCQLGKSYHFIAEKVQTIAGVAETRTIITFKAFGGS
jgi:hypothetical protein